MGCRDGAAMFSDLETLALILMSQSMDEDRRGTHAAEVVQELGLDSRLEPLVAPKHRTRRTYAEAIATLSAFPQIPEPQRTELNRGEPRGGGGSGVSRGIPHEQDRTERLPCDWFGIAHPEGRLCGKRW